MVPVREDRVGALAGDVHDGDLRKPLARYGDDVAADAGQRIRHRHRPAHVCARLGLEVALEHERARDHGRFLREDSRQALHRGGGDVVEGAASLLGHRAHVLEVSRRAVAVDHHRRDRDARGLEGVEQGLRGRRGIAVGDHDHVALARAHAHQSLVGERECTLPVLHVAHHHATRRRDRRGLVSGELHRVRPLRAVAAAAEAEDDDADVIEPRERLDGRDRHLLPPVVALRHLARVHDERERATRQLASRRRIHLHRDRLGRLAVDPSACAE